MSDEEKVVESPPDPTLGQHDESTSRKYRLKKHFSEEIDTSAGYLPLLICCFVTGLTDGTLYNAYGTFVSMQTGNTIFVALGTSGQNNRPYGWARSLCSIGCFTIGCLLFARLHALWGGARLRRTVLGSFLLQTACVAAAAGIIQGGVIDGAYPSQRDPADVNFTELAAVALLSFQAAGQIVNSRGLGVGEVPTVVVTSLLCDLVGDERLLARPGANPKRDRRAAAFVLTLLGAVCGGWISKATGAVQPSLWFVAAIKAAITIGWLGWGGLLNLRRS